MKTRFHTLLSLLLLLCLWMVPLPAPAGDAVPAVPSYSYTGEVSGLSCAACFRMVKTSLEKMPGVTRVKLVPGKPVGTAILEIKSSSPDLNREAAVKALGTNAESFPVRSLERITRS